MAMALLDGSNMITDYGKTNTNTSNKSSNSNSDSNSNPNSNDNDDDDELTNLTWLQDKNLLQNIRPNETDCILRVLNEDNENVSPSPNGNNNSRVKIDVDNIENDNNENGENGNIRSVSPVMYDPKLHRNTKPPYSFSSLIFMAIESSPGKALPVKDIYAWIIDNFPYYLTAPSGWKNTVRHNLSLNKCFRKIDKVKDELVQIAGKGALWCVDPKLRPNLLQAVRRTPAHIYPYMSLAKTNTVNVVAPTTNKIQLTNNNNTISSSQTKRALAVEQSMVSLQQPHLLPLLAKVGFIPIAKLKKDKEADAAVSMLTLQCNIANNNNNAVDLLQDEENVETLPEAYIDDLDAPVVTITVSPSTDHTYSNRNTTSSHHTATHQLYQIVHVANNDTSKVISTNNNNIENKKIPIAKLPIKRKLSSIQNEAELKLAEEKTKNKEQANIKKVDVKNEPDDDSNDEGMRGAEALLNLATSNKKGQQTGRPIILKKLRKTQLN